jgi:hypothetical protein
MKKDATKMWIWTIVGFMSLGATIILCAPWILLIAFGSYVMAEMHCPYPGSGDF